MSRAMRLSRWLVAVVVLALLAACATGPRVRTDFDPEANFAQYRSYGFYKPLAMEESGYTSYLTDRIRANVRREMDARGYVFNEASPDLLVNFQGVLRERLDVWSMPYGGMHHFYARRGFYGYPYFGGGFWYDQAQVTPYTEGTLTVDLVDAARNRLVWSGAASARVAQRSPQSRMTEADRSIAAIFNQFPYRAGAAGVPQPR